MVEQSLVIDPCQTSHLLLLLNARGYVMVMPQFEEHEKEKTTPVGINSVGVQLWRCY